MQEQTRRRIGRDLLPGVSIWLLISTIVTYAAGELREPRASLLLGQVAVLACERLALRPSGDGWFVMNLYCFANHSPKQQRTCISTLLYRCSVKYTEGSSVDSLS